MKRIRSATCLLTNMSLHQIDFFQLLGTVNAGTVLNNHPLTPSFRGRGKRKEYKMERQTTLIKEHETEGMGDMQIIQKLYDFLTSKRINIGKKKAFSVVYFLQEHVPVFPDNIEQCSVCGTIYDANSEGHHSVLTKKYYCSESCEPPGLWEREQRAEKKSRKKK